MSGYIVCWVGPSAIQTRVMHRVPLTAAVISQRIDAKRRVTCVVDMKRIVPAFRWTVKLPKVTECLVDYIA